VAGAHPHQVCLVAHIHEQGEVLILNGVHSDRIAILLHATIEPRD
jgi:hypothetical protein